MAHGVARRVGAVPPLIGWLLTRKKAPVTALSTVLEVSTFSGLAFCLAMRALAYGGLDSRLVQGISLLLMVQTLAVPSRWQRMALPVAVTWSTYPLTMLVAALYSPAIASQWHSAPAQGFAVDYLIVAGFAVGGVIGAHIIWSMRRQLYYARRLGRYRLKARIGHGGTSEVWLAWDDALRRDVALKILDRTASIDAITITRFEREAMAASGLQSPHTIRVFDFGASDDGVWFMAMEHLEGMDLATLVEEMGPLPVARVIRFARQACAALSEAHDAGVVHRDVKPDNLFVCRMGDEADFLKVLDFGIAKIEGSEEASVTRSGWVHGTPSYMSPEACNGTRVDARSDIYSVGAVLYFLLTGAPPFQAATGAAVMLAHVSEEPELPSTKGVRVPRDLERVVMKCLDKDPDARFQSARELDRGPRGVRRLARDHGRARRGGGRGGHREHGRDDAALEPAPARGDRDGRRRRRGRGRGDDAGVDGDSGAEGAAAGPADLGQARRRLRAKSSREPRVRRHGTRVRSPRMRARHVEGRIPRPTTPFRSRAGRVLRLRRRLPGPGMRSARRAARVRGPGMPFADDRERCASPGKRIRSLRTRLARLRTRFRTPRTGCPHDTTRSRRHPLRFLRHKTRPRPAHSSGGRRRRRAPRRPCPCPRDRNRPTRTPEIGRIRLVRSEGGGSRPPARTLRLKSRQTAVQPQPQPTKKENPTP